MSLTFKSVNAFLALTLFAFAGCDRKQQPSATHPGETRSGRTAKINVAAAADLRYAMPGLVAGFRSVHPEVEPAIVFGSSGNLYAQISNHAPFDVFMSADAGYPDKLISEKAALPETRFVYAMGSLVLWIPNEFAPASDRPALSLLKSDRFRKIAIANPRLAPYGRAAEAALKKEGVWDAVKDRIVLGENIAQTAQFLTTHAADAGLVSQSLALAEPLKSSGTAIQIPESDYPSIEQVAVVITASPQPETAKEFCNYIAGDAGRTILRSNGLRPPAR